MKNSKKEGQKNMKEKKDTAPSVSIDSATSLIFEIAAQNNRKFNAQELQLFLYFMQLEHINLFEAVLFDDEFRAWTKPVIPQVFQEYRRYGSLLIPSRHKHLEEIKSAREEIAYFNDGAEIRLHKMEAILKKMFLMSESHLKDIATAQSPYRLAKARYDENKIPLGPFKDSATEALNDKFSIIKTASLFDLMKELEQTQKNP